MSRYIDIDDVANAIYHHFPSIRTMADARGVIEEAPSIDIKPKRERCEYCKDGDFIGQRIMLGNDGKWHKINFCPNCGADMRERKESE